MYATSSSCAEHDISRGYFTRFKSGIWISAFNERAVFPPCRGMTYLEELLRKPNTPIDVSALKQLGMSGQLSEPSKSQRSTDAQAVREVRERWATLDVLIPRLELEQRAAEDRNSHAMAHEFASDIETFTSERKQLLAWLKDNTSVFGRSTSFDDGYRRSVNIARTTTRKNIQRMLETFRRRRLVAIANHLGSHLKYRWWHWVYEPNGFEWIVEIDM